MNPSTQPQIRQALDRLAGSRTPEQALASARALHQELGALQKDGSPLDRTHPELSDEILRALKELHRGVCTPDVTAELYRIEGKLIDLHSLYADTGNDPHYVLGRLRRDTLISMIRALPEAGRGTFLDLGCADGTYLGPLAPSFREAYGADISESRLERIRKALPKVEAFCLDLNSQKVPLADGSVSVVLATEILEHIENVPHLMSEISRCLEPGGLLFASFPNRGSVVRRIEALRAGREVSHSAWFHPNDWDLADFERVIAPHGLEVASKRGVGLYVPKVPGLLGNYAMQKLLSAVPLLARCSEDLLAVCRKT